MNITLTVAAQLKATLIPRIENMVKNDPDVKALLLKLGHRALKTEKLAKIHENEPKAIGFWPFTFKDKIVKTVIGPITKEAVFEMLRKQKAPTGTPVAIKGSESKGFATCRVCDARLGTKDAKLGAYLIPDKALRHYNSHKLPLAIYTHTIQAKSGTRYVLTTVGKPTGATMAKRQ